MKIGIIGYGTSQQEQIESVADCVMNGEERSAKMNVYPSLVPDREGVAS